MSIAYAHCMSDEMKYHYEYQCVCGNWVAVPDSRIHWDEIRAMASAWGAGVRKVCENGIVVRQFVPIDE